MKIVGVGIQVFPGHAVHDHAVGHGVGDAAGYDRPILGKHGVKQKTKGFLPGLAIHTQGPVSLVVGQPGQSPVWGIAQIPDALVAGFPARAVHTYAELGVPGLDHGRHLFSIGAGLVLLAPLDVAVTLR